MEVALQQARAKFPGSFKIEPDLPQPVSNMFLPLDLCSQQASLPDVRALPLDPSDGCGLPQPRVSRPGPSFGSASLLLCDFSKILPFSEFPLFSSVKWEQTSVCQAPQGAVGKLIGILGGHVTI